MTNPNCLKFSTPAQQGVDPQAICRLIDAWEKDQLGIHSMMLLRNDRIIAQSWWAPYLPEYPHMLNSLSKSFTSTAVGFAIQDGLLTVEDPVLSFFPGMVEHPHENMKKMRVKHLLTMSSGHDPVNADFIFKCDDPVRAFLESEVQKEPGTRFVYNTGATYMLSVIITKLTGKPVLDYLQEKLFDPLDIHGIYWEHCPQGNSLGGVGLNVKTEDIAKLGLLYLHEGKWNGRQLLDAAWIRTASARHISNDGSTETPWLDCAEETPTKAAPTDWNQGYGYQFWRCVPKNVYRGDGAFGQYCIVLPDQNAVLAITAGVGDMQKILTHIWNILLPAMRSQPFADDTAAQQQLENVLHSRVLPMPEAKAAPQAVPNRTYQLEENVTGIRRIAFRFDPDGRDALIVTVNGKDYPVYPGRGIWHEQHFDVVTPRTFPFQPAAPYADQAFTGAWSSPSTYELRMACTRAAYVRTVQFEFIDDRVNIRYHQNVCCAPEGFAIRGFML